MNYYERHLGDFAKDTAHLSALEVGVYDLLMDRYYASEKPIPHGDVYRVTRARSREEKSAADFVLEEFFSLVDGFHYHKRIDAEISRYRDKEPEREKRKADAAERQRRARERRVALFDALRMRGVVPSIKTPTADLERMIEEHDNTQTDASRHAYVTRDNTLTQSPDTSHQYINPIARDSVTSTDIAPAVEVCARLLREGIHAVTPQDPRLLELIKAGATVDEIAGIGPEAKAKGKGFPWILATAAGRRRDAAAIGSLPKIADKPWYITASGIESKGAELGIALARDETFPAYKARVLDAAGITDDMVRVASSDFGTVHKPATAGART